MLIDLHTHTSHLSMDSVLSVGDLVALAIDRGLDGICLTEHNAVWEPRELEALREKYDFPIFSGMEVGTEKGHVLVFGLERFTLEFLYTSTATSSSTTAIRCTRTTYASA